MQVKEIVDSKEKVMASEISLYKDLIDMKKKLVTTTVPVFWNRTWLSLFVYLNTSLELEVSKLGVGLIYGCNLYLDFYGTSVVKDVFLKRETKGFASQRRNRFLVCEIWSKHDNIDLPL